MAKESARTSKAAERKRRKAHYESLEDGDEDCPLCCGPKGTGFNPDCNRCLGTMKIPLANESASKPPEIEKWMKEAGMAIGAQLDDERSECPRCEGTGLYNFHPCVICKGEGWISERKLLSEDSPRPAQPTGLVSDAPTVHDNPSCTVCGTPMQFKCPKCGSTPQCTDSPRGAQPEMEKNK